jgi:hypothetical protein
MGRRKKDGYYEDRGEQMEVAVSHDWNPITTDTSCEKNYSESSDVGQAQVQVG